VDDVLPGLALTFSLAAAVLVAARRFELYLFRRACAAGVLSGEGGEDPGVEADHPHTRGALEHRLRGYEADMPTA